MTKRWRALGVTVLVAALAVCGCGETTTKKVSLRTVQATHTVLYEKTSAQLNPVEYSALDAFIQSLPLGAVSSVTLEVNQDDILSKKRLHSIDAWLISRGIARDVIRYRHWIEPSQADAAYKEKYGQLLLLTVQFTQVVPPQPCPDWSENAIADYNNPVFSNFGCAYNNNLAVQLQNPGDLASGSGASAISAARDSVALQAYMSGTAPAATSSSSSAGSGSSGASTGATR